MAISGKKDGLHKQFEYFWLKLRPDFGNILMKIKKTVSLAIAFVGLFIAIYYFTVLAMYALRFGEFRIRYEHFDLQRPYLTINDLSYISHIILAIY